MELVYYGAGYLPVLADTLEKDIVAIIYNQKVKLYISKNINDVRINI